MPRRHFYPKAPARQLIPDTVFAMVDCFDCPRYVWFLMTNIPTHLSHKALQKVRQLCKIFFWEGCTYYSFCHTIFSHLNGDMLWSAILPAGELWKENRGFASELTTSAYNIIHSLDQPTSETHHSDCF